MEPELVLRFHLCNQANGYSVLFDGPLRFAGENSFLAAREEWFEREDVLLSIKCRLGGKDLGVVRLNGVYDLKDAALCQYLRRDIYAKQCSISRLINSDHLVKNRTTDQLDGNENLMGKKGN